jgi:EAL domain-containing protein (putative c-di-GMP-specific phosphodiesterase class I)
LRAHARLDRSSRLTSLRIRRAIRADQLVLHCQPTVDCLTGTIVGAEALVRWRHPSRGLIAPGSWVPQVETSGLAREFNLHVLSLAIRQHDAWVAEGVDLPLSVNVTPACLANDKFVEGVDALFADRSPEGAIELEITERTTEINTASLLANAEALAARGFRFLLDDFGAGYSSLARLSILPVATLKIDGSLVGDITFRRVHALIVDTVVGLTRQLGQGVIAEGVEDEATWLMLQALGCGVIQGYQVSRPMPAEDFPAYVRAYRPALPDVPTPGRAHVLREAERAERRIRADRRRFDRRCA